MDEAGRPGAMLVPCEFFLEHFHCNLQSLVTYIHSLEVHQRARPPDTDLPEYDSGPRCKTDDMSGNWSPGAPGNNKQKSNSAKTSEAKHSLGFAISCSCFIQVCFMILSKLFENCFSVLFNVLLNCAGRRSSFHAIGLLTP